MCGMHTDASTNRVTDSNASWTDTNTWMRFGELRRSDSASVAGRMGGSECNRSGSALGDIDDNTKLSAERRVCG